MKKITLALSLLLLIVLGYSTISVHATEPTTEVTTTETTTADPNHTGIIREFDVNTTTHDLDHEYIKANPGSYKLWVWDGTAYVIASNSTAYENVFAIINGSIKFFYTSPLTSYFQVTDKTESSVYIDFAILPDGTVSNVDGFIDLYKDPLGKIYITSSDVDLNAHFGYSDSIPPSFTGSALEIMVSKNVELNVETIKQYIQYTDNIDEVGDITITVLSNSYASKESTVGTYSIVFEATDMLENSSQYTISIEVIDDLADLYIVDSDNVYLPSNEPITLLNLKSFLTNYNYVTVEDDFTFNVLNDDYFENSSIKGDYLLSVEVVCSDLSTETFEMTFHVLDDLVIEDTVFGSLTTLQKVIGSTLGASLIAVALIFGLKNTKKIKRNKRRR